MDIQIEVPKERLRVVENEHGTTVRDKLEKQVNQKNETLSWKKSVKSCTQRFHNVIERHGIIFPEMKLNVNRTKYRVLLVWSPDQESFLFVDLFEKEEHYQTSKQHDILKYVHSNPQEVLKMVS